MSLRRGGAPRELCGALPRAGKTRKWPCKKDIVVGSNSDDRKGRCVLHNGDAMAAPPGADEKGGRPPETFAYRRFLPESERYTYDASPVGTLDCEIKLARTNLAAFLQRALGSDKPGLVRRLVTSTDRALGPDGKPRTITKSVEFTPWYEIYLQHIDHIRKLELARKIVLADGGGETDDEAPDPFDVWSRAQRAASEPRAGDDAPDA